MQPDDTAEGETGTTAPAMVLQMHYATLYDLQFSAYQAFYVVPDSGLAAGIYNVKMGLNWGNNVKTDTVYQFTLTKAAPAGARLTGFYTPRIPRLPIGRCTSTRISRSLSCWRPAA